jgi:hypothetical protein
LTIDRPCSKRFKVVFEIFAFFAKMVLTAPVSHRKQPEQDETNAIESNQNTVKTIDLISFPPLITAWLQVLASGGTACCRTDRRWNKTPAPDIIVSKSVRFISSRIQFYD